MAKQLNPDQARYRDNLRAELEQVCGRCPPRVVNGSYDLTVDWKKARIAALKAKTITELTAAISNMRRFE